MKPKAITVLSGGLDSTVATSIYANDYDITAITFNYGQQSIKQELKQEFWSVHRSRASVYSDDS